MTNFIELLAFGLLSLLLSLILTPAIRTLAIKIKLIDKPNYRKVHQIPTPLIGGITIGVIVLIVVGISQLQIISNYFMILISGFVMLLVGIIDDKTDMRALYKLLIEIALSLIIAFSGIRITSFYGLFGINEIGVFWQYFITVLVICTAVNAFNLMDGIDGLAGSIALLGFLLIFAVAAINQNFELAKFSLIFIGSLVGFLKFNFSKKNKVFLGDSGSLFLGFILISLVIQFLENNKISEQSSYGLLFLLTIFSIPVLDSIRVYVRRIGNGFSPFKADKSHLHHLLLNFGFSHKKITISVFLFNVLLFATGYLLLHHFSRNAVLISITCLLFLFKFLETLTTFKSWKKRIQDLEKD